MNYNVKKLSDFDPELATKLKKYCYDLNGYCQQVHKEMGPFLNEYMYQDALAILLEENNVHPCVKEYYFSVEFHGKRITHKHYVDFFVKAGARNRSPCHCASDNRRGNSLYRTPFAVTL